MKRSILTVLLFTSLLLTACNLSTPLPKASATPAMVIPAATDTTAPTNTPVPAATDTAAPSNTVPAATLTNTAVATQTPPPAVTGTPNVALAPTVFPTAYLDDRSSPVSLMESFASALNLHQYLRAYSYWTPGAAQLPSFSQFQAGYTGTKAMQLAFGAITTDAGTGQLYFAVPVTLFAQTTGGSAQTFVGCYVLHLPQPSFFGAPPIQPLAIDSATVQQVANNADTASLMAAACQDHQGSTLQVTPIPDPNDITPDRYLDDRTDGEQALRSLFNAINRKEYVRAYSYWENNAQGLPAYNKFEQGYADTAVVKLTVGTVITGHGAGQLYYQVPVTLVVTTTANATQTFVGCYTLHLGSPDAQGVPPFQPLGIASAAVNLVANNADTTSLMAAACK